MLAKESSAKIVGRVICSSQDLEWCLFPLVKLDNLIMYRTLGRILRIEWCQLSRKELVLENKNTALISPKKSYFKKDDRLKQTYAQSPKM